MLSRQLRKGGKMSLTDTYTSIVRKALKTSAKENQPKTLTPRKTLPNADKSKVKD